MSGTVVADSLSARKASVLNPAWIRPRHSNWQLVAGMRIKGYPSSAFDARQDHLYIVAQDSLYTLALKTGGLMGVALSARQDNLLLGNQSVFNPFNQKLYNFYTDQRMATRYNFSEARWAGRFAPGPPTEYWHVNKFFSRGDSALYVIGG